MKICFFNSCKVWGGGEKWYLDNLNVLSEKEIDVTLFADYKSELYKKTKEKHKVFGVRVGNLSFLNIFKIIYYTLLFRKYSFDLIIMNLPSDVKFAGIAAKLAGIKGIVYRRGSPIPIKNSILNKILFKSIINGMIANSEGTKKSINEKYDIFPKEKIQVIYNGVKFRENYEIDINNKSREKIVIGTAGRLSAEKGHRYLLDIAQKLKKNENKFEILIAGEGELKEELEEKIKKMDLSNEVKLVGFEKDIRLFLEKIDIFVLPSLWEGFGYVVVEAMESCKPVVAFEVGGVPEIIEDGLTGYLTEIKNVEKMSEKIELLIKDKKLIKKMGIAGRKRGIEIFSIEKTSKTLIEYLYKKINEVKK